MLEDFETILKEISNDIDETILTLRISSLYPTTRQEALKRLQALRKAYVGIQFMRDKIYNAKNHFAYFN